MVSQIGLCSKTNDVYKPWIADAMYWPLRGFEATGQPYWHTPVGTVLHRNEWNSTVFQLNVQGQNDMYLSIFVVVVGTVTLVIYIF